MTWISRKLALDPSRPREPIVVDERVPLPPRRTKRFSLTFIWLFDVHDKPVGLFCRRCYQVLHRSKEHERLDALGYRHLREHVRSEQEMKRKGGP